MRVLVATPLTQGIPGNDFTYAEDAELLILPLLECDHETVHGSCGCRRFFEGVTSGKSTTTALVIEHADLTVTGFKTAVRSMLSELGWTKVLSVHAIDHQVNVSTTAILAVAAQYPVGTVLERRGSLVAARTMQRVASKGASCPPASRRYQN